MLWNINMLSLPQYEIRYTKNHIYILFFQGAVVVLIVW
jgi:hypothetical protein